MKRLAAIVLLMTCFVFGPVFAQQGMSTMDPAGAKKDSTTAMSKKSSKSVAGKMKSHKKSAKKASSKKASMKKHPKKTSKEKTETTPEEKSEK